MLTAGATAFNTEWYDAENFITRSLAIAWSETPIRALFSTVDPPLRYVPFVFAIRVLGVHEYATAAIVSTTVAWIIGGLGLAGALYVVARYIYDERAAEMSLLLFIIWNVVGGISNGLLGDSWHIQIALPFAVLAFGLAVASIRADHRRRTIVRATGVGGLLTVSAAIHTMAPALIAIVIALVYLANDDFVGLGVTGIVGTATSLPLLAISEYWKRGVGSGFRQFVLVLSPLPLTPRWLLVYHADGGLLLLVLLVGAIVFALMNGHDVWDSTDAVGIFLGFSIAFFLVTAEGSVYLSEHGRRLSLLASVLAGGSVISDNHGSLSRRQTIVAVMLLSVLLVLRILYFPGTAVYNTN